MSFWKELWGLCAESPDDRSQRLREGRTVTKRKQKRYAPPPTSHPDDTYGFSGMDGWPKNVGKRK